MQAYTERALRNAIASTEMEGYRVTPRLERDCRRLLNGEISVETLVREMLQRGKEENKGD